MVRYCKLRVLRLLRDLRVPSIRVANFAFGEFLEQEGHGEDEEHRG